MTELINDTHGIGIVSQPLGDAALAARAGRGDGDAFESIMRSNNQRLFRVARSIVGSDEAAEEVVQSAYARAFQNLGRFEGQSSLATWLTRIVINAAIDEKRRTSLYGAGGARGVEGPGLRATEAAVDHVGGEEHASRRELVNLLTQAVDALPDDLRAVVAMRLIEGLSTEETASCLGLTESNVKVRLHRAKQQLRDWIDDRIGKEIRNLYQFAGERCDRIVQQVLDQLML